MVPGYSPCTMGSRNQPYMKSRLRCTALTSAAELALVGTYQLDTTVMPICPRCAGLYLALYSATASAWARMMLCVTV